VQSFDNLFSSNFNRTAIASHSLAQVVMLALQLAVIGLKKCAIAPQDGKS